MWLLLRQPGENLGYQHLGTLLSDIFLVSQMQFNLAPKLRPTTCLWYWTQVNSRSSRFESQSWDLWRGRKISLTYNTNAAEASAQTPACKPSAHGRSTDHYRRPSIFSYVTQMSQMGFGDYVSVVASAKIPEKWTSAKKIGELLLLFLLW